MKLVISISELLFAKLITKFFDLIPTILLTSEMGIVFFANGREIAAAGDIISSW